MYVEEEEQEDTRNVYALIDEYYADNKLAEEIIPKKEINTFMRKMLWSGETQEELKEMWPVLRLLLIYIEKEEIGFLDRLTVYDYIYLLWKAGHGQLEKDVYLLTEENVMYFSDVIHKFYSFLTDDASPSESKLIYMIELFRKYMYVMDKFDFPEVDINDGHFELMLRVEELTPEEGEEINDHIDNLMHKISDYFHGAKYELDINRAMSLYADGIVAIEDRNEPEFGYGFWDYFMFDYHLYETDITPLQQFYKKKRNSLTASENLMLRELLSAKLQIFEIMDINDEGEMLCKELFSEELFPLPAHPMIPVEYSQLILYAHTYSCGFVLMNYVNQYPASTKLKARIKSEIEYHLELYRCQKPKATMDDFIARHSIAVRHIISIFTTRAQLGIAPVRQLPRPVKKRNRSFISREEKNEYLDFVQRMLLSKFSCNVLWDLYCDAAAAGTLATWGESSMQSKCAVLLVFMRINMYPPLEDELCKAFAIKKDDVLQLADWIASDLKLTENDPRYLAEEGYKWAILSQM